MSDLLQLAERIVGQARPGEQVEVFLGRSHHTEVKVFDGAVESLSSADTQGVGVRVIADGRQGFAYAASLEDPIIAETLDEARDNAGFGTVDEFLGLAAPDGVEPVDLDLFRPELSAFPTERKVEMALELERAVRAADPRIRGVESADYGDSVSESAIASTEGVRATTRRSGCSIVASAMAGEGTETMTGSGYSVARTPEDLDMAKAVKDASEKATRLLGARKPPSRRLTVLLDPSVSASFLGLLSSGLSASSVIKGRSLFAGREGEPVAVPFLTLVDDPTEPQAWGAGRYDAEGLASRRNVLIQDGVLQGFLHNTYTGRRCDQPSNASAVRGGYRSTPGAGSRALSLTPGDRSQEQLMADIGEGLLVQSVTGLHSGANPISGDFSVGVEGLLFRDGAPAEPVREATIASTLQRMLLDLVALGGDLEWLPGGAAGLTVVIGDVQLSGS
ncbi:MAG: TldE protein, part of TldE/TldD proteolytic complex [uncultured Acidimicrobiales bacterium]|uniref:TldE protein, part of TldE/TldD proteolytic complex n=1 Tax=uncultured Acidimicrobiales bacterium TaxID=310071 RepID=A0A6J4HYT0_9ACTN|nr:MAG: TldE protein, part of TldE/TldD proteolytic complex [uncultured Acidimicrobiales bacterium]